MIRRYSDYICPGATILSEIFESGQSGGWAGSLDELSTLKEQLKPYNIHYVDDMQGIWKRRTHGAEDNDAEVSGGRRWESH